MKNIEYSDINKFLVSLGIVLISISVTIPYAYLSNSYGLIVKENDFLALADFSKSLMNTKYSVVTSLKYVIPVISGIIFLLGLFAFFIGFRKWNKKQEKQDLMDEYNLEEKRRKLEHDFSLNKIIEKADVNNEPGIETRVLINEVQNHETQKQNYVSLVLDVENKFEKLLRKFFSDQYKIKSTQRLDNFEYDFILNSPMGSQEDKILEIKYFEKSVSYHYTRELLNGLATKLELYKSKIKEKTNGYLIVFVHTQLFESNSLSHFADTTKDFENLLNGNFKSQNVKMKFLNIDSFEFISKDSIDNILEVGEKADLSWRRTHR